MRGALVKAPMLVSVTAFLLHLAVCNDSDGKDNPAEMQNRRADIKKSNIRQTFGLKNKKNSKPEDNINAFGKPSAGGKNRSRRRDFRNNQALSRSASMILRKFKAARSGNIPLIYIFDPISKPAVFVRRGIIDIYQ